MQLTQNDTYKGNFLKRCPGTPKYLCCNYYVLNIQTNCNFDCHYCILQDYLNKDPLITYTNIQDALNQVKITLDNNPNKFYRIGTGELTDSLSIDHITNSSLTLIPFFNKCKNALLELKTKSNNINNLLKLKPEGNIVIAWSLNPQHIIDTFENKTASLSQRLEAVKQCSNKGYKIAFHFDPVILYPNWEKDYHALVKSINKFVPPENIVWISVAGLRYSAPLKKLVLERFPKTNLFNGEMIKALDGKYRYIRPLRVDMYKKMIQWIKELNNNIPIYFCMESSTVWNDVFGKQPEEIQNLKGIFGDTWWER